MTEIPVALPGIRSDDIELAIASIGILAGIASIALTPPSISMLSNETLSSRMGLLSENNTWYCSNRLFRQP